MSFNSALNRYAVGTFLISPFLSILLFSKKYKTKQYLNLVWFFFAFLGYILVTNNESGDSYRYTMMFKEYAALSFEGQLNYFTDDARLDLFRPVTFRFISSFTSNPKIYFAFVAFFFGYFYSRILGFMFQNIHQKLNLILVLIIVNYLFFLNFYGFQFVRFNTATVLFIYFLLKYYLEEKKKKYLLLTGLSIFIHFTYVFPVSFLLIYQFLPTFRKLYFYGFMITAIFTVVEFDYLASNLESYLPQELESRKGYLDSEYKERITLDAQEANWYIKIRGPWIKYTSLMLLVLSYLTYKKSLYYNPKYEELISFLLFFGIFANIVSIVPSGSRFLSITYATLWLILITVLVNNYQIFFRKAILKYYLIVFFSFNLIIGLRYLFDVFPIEFFSGNFISIMFGTTDVELINFVKQVLM